MTVETEVAALTQQTSNLLGECLTLKSNTETQIATAVATSENAALIPLAIMATNLIDMQTLLVTLITG